MDGKDTASGLRAVRFSVAEIGQLDQVSDRVNFTQAAGVAQPTLVIPILKAKSDLN